jgi:hypothetical protein
MLSGATQAQYKVVLADQAKYLASLVIASNTIGNTQSTSNSVLVPKATKPVLKSMPRISGSAVGGNSVTLNSGTWSANPAPTTTQQWYRCEKPVLVNSIELAKSLNCAKISGATKVVYKIAVADQNKYLTALIRTKNSQGFVTKSVKSVKVPGTKPTAKASPGVSGSPKANGVLRATLGSWAAIPAATTSLQWYRCSTSVPAGTASLASSMGCKKISGATSNRYTVKVADQGKYLTVLVKAMNTEGNASSSAKSKYVQIPVVSPQQ